MVLFRSLPDGVSDTMVYATQAMVQLLMNAQTIMRERKPAHVLS